MRESNNLGDVFDAHTDAEFKARCNLWSIAVGNSGSGCPKKTSVRSIS
jgi:hypothetical protein